eukprot:961429-Pyramimonas_sp.AAC.1
MALLCIGLRCVAARCIALLCFALRCTTSIAPNALHIPKLRHTESSICKHDMDCATYVAAHRLHNVDCTT